MKPEKPQVEEPRGREYGGGAQGRIGDQVERNDRYHEEKGRVLDRDLVELAGVWHLRLDLTRMRAVEHDEMPAGPVEGVVTLTESERLQRHVLSPQRVGTQLLLFRLRKPPPQWRWSGKKLWNLNPWRQCR